MTEPVPRRHRRRERRRFRPAGGSPAGAGGTSDEYEPPGDGAPAEGAPAESGSVDSAPADTVGVGPASPESALAAEPAPGASPEAGAGPGRKARPARRGDAERGLRGIVGSGPSQVGVTGAMRARDAARPTAEDIAAAERDLVIVRRHYVPPDADPRTG